MSEGNRCVCACLDGTGGMGRVGRWGSQKWWDLLLSFLNLGSRNVCLGKFTSD